MIQFVSLDKGGVKDTPRIASVLHVAADGGVDGGEGAITPFAAATASGLVL